MIKYLEMEMLAAEKAVAPIGTKTVRMQRSACWRCSQSLLGLIHERNALGG